MAADAVLNASQHRRHSKFYLREDDTEDCCVVTFHGRGRCCDQRKNTCCFFLLSVGGIVREIDDVDDMSGSERGEGEKDCKQFLTG